MLALTSPVETPYHRLPAGLKLAALCGFTVLLFRIGQPWPMAATLAVVAGLTLLPGQVFAGHALRLLRPLWPFAALLVLWHLWARTPGDGAVILMRMTAAVAAANLMTMTTRLSGMMQVIEWLARPLSAVLPPRRLSLAMALTVRFVPVLAERQAALALAWRARSARGGPGWRIVPALTLGALDEADQVAEALRARGGTD